MGSTWYTTCYGAVDTSVSTTVTDTSVNVADTGVSRNFLSYLY